MVSLSPAEALGPHARDTGNLLVEVIRSRHERAVEAHLASGSRYSMGFGSQWRDLLDDAQEMFANRGYQSHKLLPAGYKLPVVNNCLLYVWRIPSIPDAVTGFAASPTRKNGFSAQPPAPMLFEPGFEDESDHDGAFANAEKTKIEHAVRAGCESMPVVLIVVHSSPSYLQSIEWAVAELDETGKVKLHGREPIWKPEANVQSASSDVEAFDRGTPVEPVVEPREREGIEQDAR